MAAALAGMREHVAPSGGDFRKIFKRFLPPGALVRRGSAGLSALSLALGELPRRAST